jgi:flagellar basal body-associated protein FliL
VRGITSFNRKGDDPLVSILWIILIVVLVLLLLGFFSRGRW